MSPNGTLVLPKGYTNAALFMLQKIFPDAFVPITLLRPADFEGAPQPVQKKWGADQVGETELQPLVLDMAFLCGIIYLFLFKVPRKQQVVI